ncbi:MAG: hypothetical protein NZ992_00615 [Candidatus Korarchaeum sp.]|nr:hypothetical protein [Candidatus Korarchaeum sp.]MDW8035230.1 hypothetical protein [Candidatus Korarchaeum sp.]
MKWLSIPLAALGILLILASLSFSPLLWERRGLLERGTYELIPCNASYLLLTVNATPCISAYNIQAELLSSGSELELNVTQPMIVVRGNVTFELKKGSAELSGSYQLKDGGTIIPAGRGNYVLYVKGDHADIYDIRSISELNLVIEESEGKLKIQCLSSDNRFLDRTSPSILIHSQNDVSYDVEAYGEVPEKNLLLIGIGFLVLAAVSRYVSKSRGGEGE